VVSSVLHVSGRVAAALLGSYGLVWGFISLGVTLGVAAGMPFEDSQTLLYLLAFPLFVACACWAFSARSMGRVWLCLGGGGLLMTAFAWALSARLV